MDNANYPLQGYSGTGATGLEPAISGVTVPRCRSPLAFVGSPLVALCAAFARRLLSLVATGCRRCVPESFQVGGRGRGGVWPR